MDTPLAIPHIPALDDLFNQVVAMAYMAIIGFGMIAICLKLLGFGDNSRPGKMRRWKW